MVYIQFSKVYIAYLFFFFFDRSYIFCTTEKDDFQLTQIYYVTHPSHKHKLHCQILCNATYLCRRKIKCLFIPIEGVMALLMLNVMFQKEQQLFVRSSNYAAVMWMQLHFSAFALRYSTLVTCLTLLVYSN